MKHNCLKINSIFHFKIILLVCQQILAQTAIDFNLDSVPVTYLDYYQSYSQCKYFAVKSNFGGVSIVLKTDESVGYKIFNQTASQTRNYLTSCSEDKVFAGDINQGIGQINSYKGYYQVGKTEPQSIDITITGQILFASNDDHYIMKIQGTNQIRFGLLYYDQDILNYAQSNELINTQNGWQFMNITINQNGITSYKTMLVTIEDQNIKLYDFNVQNKQGILTNYTIEKPNGNTIISSETNFISKYLVLQDENLLYFYTIQIVDGEIQIQSNNDQQFDMLTMYDMFNVTNNYIKPSKLMQIQRTIVYSQDTLIFYSSYSEYDGISDNLLAFYRIVDNNLQYLWTSSNIPSHIESDHLGTLIFQGNFDRGNQNTLEINLDNLLDSYDLQIDEQIESCYLQQQLIDITSPINNPNLNQIELKLKDGLDYDIIEDQYHCTLDHTTISYVDYYQRVNLQFDETNHKYTGQVQLKSAQLACEFQAANYPSQLNGKLISNQILNVENTVNLESCYNSAQFTADIDNNNVTFTKPSYFTPNSCQIDKPDITAILEYQGNNYSHEMQQSITPSIQQLVSYNALFEPNLFPSFQSDDLKLYLIIKSFSPSGILLRTYEKQFTLSQDLDTCFDSQEKTWLVYYNNAFHVKNIDVLESKYDKPCIFIYDFDIFDVKIYSQDRTRSQLLETNSWEQYNLMQNEPFKYITPPYFNYLNITDDMAHYYDIDISKEQISSKADFKVSIDDGDSDKIHEYQLNYLNYFRLPCILVPSGISMYQIDDEVYLDVSGDRNCNADLGLTMDDLTLLTESEECDLESQVSSYLYKGTCIYYKNSLLKYEFSVDFTWETYEIEEDFVMYLPVQILDKSKQTSYWEAYLTVLLVIPVGIYVGLGVYYWLKCKSEKQDEITDQQNNDTKTKELNNEGESQQKLDQKDVLDFENEQQDDNDGDINQGTSDSNSQDDFYMYDSIPMPKFK